MGMYTALEVKCTVKPEMVRFIDKLHEEHSWDKVAEMLGAPAFISGWAMVGRAIFIPFGVLNVWRGEGGSNFTPDNVWHFTCSLKNYEGEIEHFFLYVLPGALSPLQRWIPLPRRPCSHHRIPSPGLPSAMRPGRSFTKRSSRRSSPLPSLSWRPE